jgi:pimeloyl-ACP methyl ester carboxylesterase
LISTAQIVREEKTEEAGSMTKKLLFAGLLAGGALATLAWRRRHSSGEAQAPTFGSRRFVDVGGIRMSWVEEGEGVPVVLVHGIPTSPDLWRHVVPRLSGVRVLAWEMVGYGESISEGKGRNISVAEQAEYLSQWMRELGVEKAILAGHDLGGGVAQILAVRHPQLCSGLFLTNAISYDSWPIPSVVAMRNIGGLVRKLPDPAFKALLLSLFLRGHDDVAKGRDALQVHAPKYTERDGAAAMVRQMDALHVEDTLAIADKLPSLNIPARLAWGEADQFQKIEYAERLSRDLDAPLRRIKGGKHFTPEDHPEVIAEEIMALVWTVEAQRGSEEVAPA